MLRFAHPEMLNFIWLIIPLIFAFYFFEKRQSSLLKSSYGLKIGLFLTASVSNTKRRVKLVLQSMAILFFALALAQPQSGSSKQKANSQGIEIVILFDVSQSMLAEDVKPSRLEFAKKEVTRFIDSSTGDRVGLIAFAGSAVLQTPVTTDKGALKMFVESLAPESVSTQGTEFRKALDEAEAAFKRGGVEEDPDTVVTRAVVIVSDGEDNEEGAIEAAEKLAKKGTYIFGLAFGTKEGGFIPVKDRDGNAVGYKKDRKGNPILTSTNGSILKSLAKKGQGSFYHVSFGSKSIDQLSSDLKKLQQTNFKTAEFVSYQEHYQWFLIFGILFGVIDLLLGDRKGPVSYWKGRFEAVK